MFPRCTYGPRCARHEWRQGVPEQRRDREFAASYNAGSGSDVVEDLPLRRPHSVVAVIGHPLAASGQFQMATNIVGLYRASYFPTRCQCHTFAYRPSRLTCVCATPDPERSPPGSGPGAERRALCRTLAGISAGRFLVVGPGDRRHVVAEPRPPAGDGRPAGPVRGTPPGQPVLGARAAFLDRRGACGPRQCEVRIGEQGEITGGHRRAGVGGGDGEHLANARWKGAWAQGGQPKVAAIPGRAAAELEEPGVSSRDLLRSPHTSQTKSLTELLPSTVRAGHVVPGAGAARRRPEAPPPHPLWSSLCSCPKGWVALVAILRRHHSPSGAGMPGAVDAANSY